MEIIKSIVFHFIIILIATCTSEGNSVSTASPRTFYFDTNTGNDNHSGLSADQAFKSLNPLKDLELRSGDKILLANGSRFRGSIFIDGFTAKGGLQISNYQSPGLSTQEKPIIDASGHLSGIRLQNTSHIRISNLSITADGGGITNPSENTLEGMRCGLLVHVTSDRSFENIIIENVEIEKVYYEERGFLRGEDEVTTPNGTQSYGWGIRFLNTSSQGQLSNISVLGCRIRQLSHSGIRFHNSSQKKFQNITIQNNVLEKTGGPGMVLLKCDQALVTENNISYSGSEEDSRNWGRGSGLWTWGSSHVLIDRNTFSHANGPADSACCHIDFNCNDIIVQRNLSWSNAGGFIEILGNNYNCAYRYNLSINDGYRVKGEGNNFQEGKTFWLSGFAGKNNARTGPFNTYIYNNTIYANASIVSKIAVDRVASGVLVANNIFHLEGKSQLVLGDQYRPDDGGTGTIKNVTFANNIFLNDNYWPKEALIQPNQSIIGDVLFQKKGGTTLLDYRPTAKQLVSDKGIAIPKIVGDAKGLYLGFTLDQDLLGHPIKGLPDMGAIEME